MSEEKISIEINGQSLTASKGQMIIQVADAAGINIPRFCYHKKLSIAANCRMCLVEVEKMPKPVPACATPVMPDMKIHTQSELALDAQRGVMEFLLINHPLDCPICDQGGECELQDVAMGYGSSVARYAEMKRVVFDEDIGPLVSTDMTRCIHCTRCVRFGDEVAGLRELGATGRGENMRIGTYVKQAMASEMSGNIIDLCPVGALNNKPYRYSARAWEMTQHPIISPHDCVGSNMYVHTLRGEVKRAVPCENEAINEAWLSDRDRFSCHALQHTERAKEPLLKRDGQWQEVGWDEALQYVQTAIQKIIKEHGPQSIGGLISPNATLEEHYLLQKVLRGLGSDNIDHRVYQYDFNGDEQEPTIPWLGMDIAEIEQLDALLLVGSNVRKDQPLLAHRLRKAALKGAEISFINHRAYEFQFPVQQQLVVQATAMEQNLSAIVNALIELTGNSTSLDISRYLSDVSVEAEHKRIAEQLLHKANSAVWVGSNLYLHPQYSVLRTLLFCIAELTNSTFGYLSIGGNSAGAWLAGAVPNRTLAGKAVATTGMSAKAMWSGGLKAALLFGVEPAYESWNAQEATAAMQASDLVVAFNAYTSAQILEIADIILPIASFAETFGTIVNVEGRWQSFAGAAKPVGSARPGWKVLRVLGNQLDLADFDYVAAEEVSQTVQQACVDIELNNLVKTLPVAQATHIDESSTALQRISDLGMYYSDGVLRRAEDLQQTIDGKWFATAAISSNTAKQLGAEAARKISLKQNNAVIESVLLIDDSVPDQCVWLACGGEKHAALGSAFGPITVEAFH